MKGPVRETKARGAAYNGGNKPSGDILGEKGNFADDNPPSESDGLSAEDDLYVGRLWGFVPRNTAYGIIPPSSFGMREEEGGRQDKIEIAGRNRREVGVIADL